MSATERLARLESAAVALLDPLIAPGRNWRNELPAQLDSCAAVAASLKLAGFAKLATHIARCLRKVTPDETDKELAGQWIARAIVFCSGQMQAGDPDELVDLLVGWPLLRRLSNPEALSRLKPRLINESDRLSSARLRAESAMPVLTPVTMASNEMMMIAVACEDMQAALARNDPETSRALSEFADSLGNTGNALEHLGLSAVADLFRGLARDVFDAIHSGQAFAGEQTEALVAWPGAFAQWFRHPEAATTDRAVNAHAAAIGLNPAQAQPALIRQAHGQMQAVRVVAVRAPEPARDPGELSMSVPADTDPVVMQELVRELPVLANELAAAAVQLRARDASQVDAVRRVAHTIKGAANTAGVDGIARLTHGLEDLLDVIAALSSDRLEAEWADVIVDAVDSVGELIDALVARIEPGSDCLDRARDAERAVAELVRDLSLDPGSDGTESTPVAVDIADFELPDLNLAEPVASAPLVPDGLPGAGQGTGQTAGSASPGEPPAADDSAASLPVMGLPAGRDFEADPKTDKPVTERAPPPADDPVFQASTPVEQAPPPVMVPPGTAASLNAQSIEHLLESADESALLLGRARASVDALLALRRRWQSDAERLNGLSREIERLADPPPEQPHGAVPADAGSTDYPEIEQFSESQVRAQRLSEVAADGKLMDQQLGIELNGLSELMGKLEDRQAALRDDILAMRLVAVQGIEPRLQRVARQAARQSGKAVSLHIDGADVRIDADLLQQLVEPLSHLVRNAVDHGLETPAERREAGKPSTGQVIVGFTREAGSVRVSVRDDGRGLDTDAIRRRAIRLGLIPRDARLDDSAMSQLVTAPGFSTREQVSQVSGRGIGLDVVTQALRNLRGDMTITFEAGLGACFDLTLPVQMSAVPVFVIRSATHICGVSIRGIVQLITAAQASEVMSAPGRITWEGRTIAVRQLDEALGLSRGMLDPDDVSRAGTARGAGDPDGVVAIVQGQGAGMTAVQMPDPGQTRDVIVRSLPRSVSHLPGIDGVAVLGDGAVAPVYDLPELMATTMDSGPDRRFSGQYPLAAGQAPLCLLVDDSASVRRATADLVRDLGLRVTDVASGRQALKVLKDTEPALVITDLEMPDIDGLELTRAIRADPRYSGLPVVMLTSRRTAQHQREAREAGVSSFVSKPFNENELAALIRGYLES